MFNIICYILLLILNIIIIYKIYHINLKITLIESNINKLNENIINKDINININDMKLYDTIKHIETVDKIKDIKINNIDFSTKKDIYYYKNKIM